MADFFTELLKILGTPTRARLFGLLFLMGFCTLALLSYERYTATFRLSRLEKQTELLTRIRELQMQGTNSAPELEKARRALIDQAIQVIEEKPITLEFVPSKLSFSMDSLKKFFAGALFWLVIAACHIPKIKSKEGKDTFSGVLVCAIISGFAGLFVPPIWWPWFHVLIFPWLFLAILTIAMIPFIIISVNFGTAKKKAQTNSCINNLRRIDSAKQQWSLEKNRAEGDVPTVEELKPYLARGKSPFPLCPAGGHYEIGAVNVPPKCSIAGHSLEPQVGYASGVYSVNCLNNLKQVGLAARIWADGHGDMLPSDFASMRQELGNEKIARCPVNHAPYDILSPAVSTKDPAVIYAYCPIHNHFVLVDGSVQKLGDRKIVKRDGRWLVET